MRTVAAAFGRAVTAPIAEAGSAGSALVSGIGTIRHPDRLVDALQTWGLDDHRTVNDLTSAGKLAFIGSSRTVWTGRPGARKAVAWSSPLPLAPVKQAARARGVTLNDVMVAALAGALKAYLGGRGDSVDEVVWMVPVNLKPFSAELPEDLGNHFALVMLDLPLIGSHARRPDRRRPPAHGADQELR